MSGLRYRREDRKTDADTHLFVARSQNTETGILGNTKDKGQSFCGCLFAYALEKLALVFSSDARKFIKENDGHSGGRDGA